MLKEPSGWEYFETISAKTRTTCSVGSWNRLEEGEATPRRMGLPRETQSQVGHENIMGLPLKALM